MEFFRQLGFEFNPKSTYDKAACMIVSDEACVMLLSEPFFRTFTKKAICDTSTHTEGLFALSCSSRGEVDEMVNKAKVAGGHRAKEPQDRGCMSGWSVYALDVQHWEELWMDPEGMRPMPGGHDFSRVAVAPR